MKNCHENKRKTATGVLLIAGITALGVVFTSTLPRAAQIESQAHAFPAQNIAVPPLPPDLEEVPPPHRVTFVGHAIGTQNYVCLPSGPGFAWSPFGPQATLFDDDARQIVTHFLSPNPDEGGIARATWQHSRDTSTVWAMAIESSADPDFVAPGAIPWLLLDVVGAERGPTGGHRLTETAYIQRVNTSGGLAPTTGCADATNVGNKALVPYTTDYIFYKATGHK